MDLDGCIIIYHHILLKMDMFIINLYYSLLSVLFFLHSASIQAEAHGGITRRTRSIKFMDNRNGHPSMRFPNLELWLMTTELNIVLISNYTVMKYGSIFLFIILYKSIE